MNIASTSRSIFNAVKDVPSASAKIRDEYRELALSIATDINASSQVTSSTVNGQTFSTSSSMTNGQRLDLLRLIVYYLDKSQAMSSTSISYFP